MTIKSTTWQSNRDYHCWQRKAPTVSYLFISFWKTQTQNSFFHGRSNDIWNRFERLEHPNFIRSSARICVRARFRLRGHTFVACRLFSRLQSIFRCINALLSCSHVENKNDKTQKGRARSVKTGGVYTVLLSKWKSFRCHPLNNEVNIDSYWKQVKNECR